MLAWCNMAAFIIGVIYLNGDAINGYIKNGHYYLCSHGACHETTKIIWQYSCCHAFSILVGLLFIAIERSILTKRGEIIRERVA